MDNLTQNFDTLRSLMQIYSPPLISRLEDDSHYDLWSVKDLLIEGRQRKEIYFAGLITRNTYVGFYYMPVYVDAEIKNLFAPQLLKLLKGKSCFHIKHLDDELREHIRAALAAGFEIYKNKGWI